MAKFRSMKALAVLFLFVAVFSAAFVAFSSEPAKASRSEYWVMYCTVEPPIYCREECVPCPPLWP